MSYNFYLGIWGFYKTVFVTFLMVLLSGCGQQSPQQSPHKATLVVFGTLVDLTVYHEDAHKANQAIANVEQAFQTFHHEWHAWEKGGIVSNINQAIAHKKSIEVAPSVKAFIQKSQRLTTLSQGLFDPGIGHLIQLWGFHSDHWQGPPPTELDIQYWLAQRPSILDIEFSGNRLRSQNPLVQLDFGANAKGLAIDMALEKLAQAGIKNALVSIGGDMKAMGSKNNQAWSIGIQSPQNPTKILASLTLNNGESIVTSGTYQRYFEWQGKRYAHIINPNTGYPAKSFSSVTVLHPDATTADAAATALLVAGPDDWQDIASKMGIEYVFCVTQQGGILQTPKMAARLKIHR